MKVSNKASESINWTASGSLSKPGIANEPLPMSESTITREPIKMNELVCRIATGHRSETCRSIEPDIGIESEKPKESTMMNESK